MSFAQVMFWIIPAIALSVYIFFLIVVAFSQRDKTVTSFLVVLSLLALWSGFSLLMRLDFYPSAAFWNQAMITILLCIPYAIYTFVSILSGQLSRFGMFLWGFVTVAVVVVNSLGLVLRDVAVVQRTVDGITMPDLQYQLGSGAIPVYLVLFIQLIEIIRKPIMAKRADRSLSRRLNPVIYGSIIMFAGTLLNIFPYIGKYPLDILMSIANAILLLVAVYNKKMLELRFSVTKGAVFTIMVLLISGFYVYASLRISAIVAQQTGSSEFTYANTLFGLSAALAYLPIFHLTRMFVDRIFYKSEFVRRQKLKNIAVSIYNRLDLNTITEELFSAVEDIMQSKRVYMLMRSEEEKCYKVEYSSAKLEKADFVFQDSNPIIRWFSTHNSVLTRSDVDTNAFFRSLWDREKQLFSEHEIQVFVPINCRGQLIGLLLLSGKINKLSYTSEDLDLLTSLGASTAIAIDNAFAYMRAQKEAITDNLTNLHNHRYFCKELEQLSAEDGAFFSLLLINLDMFKLYNDLYGHFEGDKALVKIAEILRDTIGSNGVAARYSGDEFAVLLYNGTEARSFEYGEKIRIAIENAFIRNGDFMQRFLTVSIGICTFPEGAQTIDDLLKNADIALFNAKNHGKNQTAIYNQQTRSPVSIKQSGGDDQMTTVFALSAAIDAKDHFTFGHSQNVADYTVKLAHKIGLDENHIKLIEQAALLHDVGKIGVPEYILTKAGRLTQEEYEIMKKHVEMSVSIIKFLPALNHVIPTVIHHHEYYNGQGYPRGVSGESIPIGARCLSIADAFDAITSSRPYKSPMPVDVALNELVLNKGRQFDPKLVDVFVDLVQNGEIKVSNSIYNTLMFKTK